MRRAAVLLVLGLAGSAHAAGPAKTPAPKQAEAKAPALPALGTDAAELPEGEGRDLARTACLPCHSADILRQQRITAKQWTATVEKMVRWGAPVKDADKDRLLAYLNQHFGPDNDRFVPLEVAPLGR